MFVLLQDSNLSAKLLVSFHSFCIHVYPSYFQETNDHAHSYFLRKTDTFQKCCRKSNALHVVKKPEKTLDITDF